MSDAPLTFTDALILVIVLGSAFLALLRGCMRETLAVSAWIFSVWLTYALYLMAGPTLSRSVSANWFVHALFALTIFAGLVTLFTLANRRILDRISNEKIPLWDQVLGFGFGFARGLCLVAILYQAHVLIFGERDTPVWLAEARLFPMVAGTADLLKVALPGPITTEKTVYDVTPLKRPEPEDDKKKRGDEKDEDEEAGYSKDDRSAIDRLLRNKLDPR